MPLPSSTVKIIASGAWAQVRVREKSGDTLKVIGLVTDADYNENFGLQKAQVLNHLGAISIDSQGYDCNIRIGTYVPELPDQGGGYADGGDTTLSQMLTTRSDVQLNGKGKTFEYMDFYNTATKTVLNAFSHAIIESDGAQIGSNQYIKNNITLQAIERTV